MEATLVLATVAQRFRLALAPDQVVTVSVALTVRPKDGVRVVVRAPDAR